MIKDKDEINHGIKIDLKYLPFYHFQITSLRLKYMLKIINQRALVRLKSTEGPIYTNWFSYVDVETLIETYK